MNFEHKLQPLAPPHVYHRRLRRGAMFAGLVIAFSLAVGIIGYHFAAGLKWLDALVNASMILGGMGPVDPVTSAGGKWFESIYALYSGIALLTSVGVLFAPAVHRFLHRFHIEAEGDGAKEPKEGRPRGHHGR
jgi:hypothetical protein